MSFASAMALLVGLLVAIPVAAHLLRRGKTKDQEFPPAALVPAVVVTSEQRSRLEDLLLLLLRALMVVALAVLGATPFVRCSDLSVDRKSGASVALAIVIDDSQSMRAKTNDGDTRFELARAGAEQLLDSARDGDAIAIISAGAPARLVLNATADLYAAKKALSQMRATDRSTDLSEAIALARSAVADLPHVDKRVAVLSDLGTPRLPKGDPAPWIPLKELREPVDNCGIALAQQESRGVLITVGCTSPEAAKGRQVEVFVLDEEDPEPIATAELQTLEGVQKVDVRVDSLGLELGVRLSGDDAIASDNRSEVAKVATDVVIAVAADPAKASTITGGPTIVVQALRALDSKLDVRPLGELPEAAEDYKRFAALVIDDPPGLSPEERAALTEWIEGGGAALALLGPSSTNTQLASSIEPFARQGAQWEEQSSVGIEPDSVAWLGGEAGSLATLSGGGRVRLDAADLPGTDIRGKWQDGVPWLFHRTLGRGLALTVGTPASVERSDFALRPGFLALLDVVVQHARQTSGPKQSIAGAPWQFPADAKVEVKGPDGPLSVEVINVQGSAKQQVVPERAGRHELQVDAETESRLVILDEQELVQHSLDAESGDLGPSEADAASMVDASPQWAILLLALFTLEILFRTYGDRLRARGGGRRPKRPATADGAE